MLIIIFTNPLLQYLLLEIPELYNNVIQIKQIINISYLEFKNITTLNDWKYNV